MTAITVSTVRKLVESQGYRCALTGVELTPKTAQLDHIVPLSQGGEHEIENCQVVHSEINRMKGMLNDEQFIRWCEMVVTYARTIALTAESS